MVYRERNYRNLKVWSAAHTLTVRVYNVTRDFPDSERFGLVAQLRRSTASIPANLAEGSAISSEASFANFVEVAYSSASEADYQLLLARDVGYLHSSEYDALEAQIAEIRRMLAALRRTLRKNGGTTGSRRSAVAFR